jgi:selenide, water dikinase
MKFGYAVTGLIDPAEVKTNARAVAGDVLILTKPIGTGVITTALKLGKAEQAWVDAAVKSMTTLNRTAAEIVGTFASVHAMTDVTGFGLMGHGREMAMGSGVTLEIETARVPVIEGALDAVRAGAIPGGLLSNREFAECIVADADDSNIPAELRMLMYDPQTSGGLLISAAAEQATELMSALREAGVGAVRIGRVRESPNGGGNPAIVLK